MTPGGVVGVGRVRGSRVGAHQSRAREQRRQGLLVVGPMPAGGPVEDVPIAGQLGNCLDPDPILPGQVHPVDPPDLHVVDQPGEAHLLVAGAQAAWRRRVARRLVAHRGVQPVVVRIGDVESAGSSVLRVGHQHTGWSARIRGRGAPAQPIVPSSSASSDGQEMVRRVMAVSQVKVSWARHRRGRDRSEVRPTAHTLLALSTRCNPCSARVPHAAWESDRLASRG